MEYYLEYIIILVLIVCIVYSLLPRKKEGLNTTTNSSDVSHRFVNYNTSWCYFSKQLDRNEDGTPGAWRQLMDDEEVRNLGVEIVDLKCDENDENGEICGAQGIEAYPTIKLHKQDGETVEYTKGRDLDSFKSFLMEELRN